MSLEVADTPHLTAVERGCLERYVADLAHRLHDMQEAWLFGSAARGDMWPDWWPANSDIDLLVVTTTPVAPEMQDELLEAVYELYLECGRTIGPQFRTAAEFDPPALSRPPSPRTCAATA